MFDIGGGELFLLILITLIVMGPERLPNVLKKIGYWVGRAKSTFSEFQSALEKEVDADKLKQDIKAHLSVDELNELADEINRKMMSEQGHASLYDEKESDEKENEDNKRHEKRSDEINLIESGITSHTEEKIDDHRNA